MVHSCTYNVEYPQQPMVARLWESVTQVYSERKSALTHGHNGRINRGRLSRTYHRRQVSVLGVCGAQNRKPSGNRGRTHPLDFRPIWLGSISQTW